MGLGLAGPSLRWDMVTAPVWTLLPLPGIQVLVGSEVRGWMF